MLMLASLWGFLKPLLANKYVLLALLLAGAGWYAHHLGEADGIAKTTARYETMIARAKKAQADADAKKAIEDNERALQFQQERDEALARTSKVVTRFVAAQAAAPKPARECKSTPAVKDALNDIIDAANGVKK